MEIDDDHLGGVRCLVLRTLPGTNVLTTLLLRRASSNRGFGKWELPGGSIDQSDDSALAAAKRELREETGLCPENVGIIKNVLLPAHWTNSITYFRFVTTEGKVVLDPDEHDTYTWIRLPYEPTDREMTHVSQNLLDQLPVIASA